MVLGLQRDTAGHQAGKAAWAGGGDLDETMGRQLRVRACGAGRPGSVPVSLPPAALLSAPPQAALVLVQQFVTERTEGRTSEHKMGISANASKFTTRLSSGSHRKGLSLVTERSSQLVCKNGGWKPRSVEGKHGAPRALPRVCARPTLQVPLICPTKRNLPDT